MKVCTVKEAWDLAARLFPGDYALDSSSVTRAGYEIYRSVRMDSNARICDLNDRLELNYDDGRSENIWIEERMAKGNALVVGV